jgi:hypothetical protein
MFRATMSSSSGGQLYEYNFWYNHSVLVRYAGQDGTAVAVRYAGQDGTVVAVRYAGQDGTTHIRAQNMFKIQINVS